MWKKILISLFALVGAFSVAYSYYNIELSATAYDEGGIIKGRVNKEPAGISNNENKFQKGDRIVLSTQNPLDSKPISFMIIAEESYSDYGCSDATNNPCATDKTLTTWFSMLDDKIMNLNPGLTTADYANDYAPYNNSKLYAEIEKFNASINEIDFDIITYRNLTISRSILNKETIADILGSITYSSFPSSDKKGTFILSSYEADGTPAIGGRVYSTNDLKFSEDYYSSSFYNDSSGRIYTNFYFTSNTGIYPTYGSHIDKNSGLETGNFMLALRPSAYLDLSNVVFAVSQAQTVNSGISKISDFKVPSNYTDLYQETRDSKGNPAMKLRIEDPTLSSSTTFKQIQTESGSELAKVPQNQTVYLAVDAQASVNENEPENNISVLIFDKNGRFIAYQTLGKAKQGGVYPVDLTGLDLGEYTIGIVNEEYDPSSTAIAKSSEIKAKTLEIVDGLSKITVTQTPIGQDTFEYSKNVNENNQVATITHTGGADPITYDLVSDEAHPNEYLNFSLSSADVTDGATSKIIVNSSGSDINQTTKSLNAGTYHLCVVAKDATGQPVDVAGNALIKECLSITVNKTNSTVAFDKDGQTKIKIGDSVGIDELITTNNSELTTTGSYAPSYEISEGVDGTGLDVTVDGTDPKKYHISIGESTSATLPATFKLKVTLPETDNYQSVTSETKDIYVYKGLDNLIWTPTKTGSYAIGDVTSGKTIGTLLASDGLPNYTYSLMLSTDEGYDAEKAKHNDKFIIDATPLGTGVKAEVKTTTSLGAGTYKLQMKVKDDVGDIKIVDATITVSANAQAALHFKENGSNITTKTIYFDDQNITVQAEGGETSITSLPTYTYSDETDKSYITIKDNGNGTATLTPVKVTESGKTVKVKATKAGNASFAEVSTELEIIIQPAKQTVSFDNTDNPRKIKLDETGVTETASGILTSDGKKGSGVGGITYTSADNSIASIDPSTGGITPHKKGTVEITATLNKQGTDDYDANYETATAKKNVFVYEGMEISWKPVTPNLKASGTASAGMKVGSITVKNNTGSVTYAPVNDTSISENVDGGLFTIDALGNVKLKNAITASDLHTHGATYKIQVTVKDDNGTQTENIEITIDLADNDFYFVNPDDLSKINKIEETFSVNGSFQLATKNSNGGTVTYKLKENENESIITVEPDGTVKMLKTGGPVLVEATVAEGSGYAGKTIELPITITKSTYKIAWQKPNTTYVKYTKDVSVEEKAILTPDGSIAYEPLTTDICEIDVNGTVTALKEGTCEIKAKSTNPNFEEVTSTKQIIFFTGAQGAFTQTNTPQAGNAPISTTIGTTQIIGLEDTSDYKYSINLETNNKNTDYSLFQVSEDYGTVSLKQAITAETLKDKTYDATKGGYPLLVQVIAKNDVTQDQVIIDCEIIIKGAKMSNVSFKNDEGKATNKISKVYQKDGTFTVDLINNTGGTPKYTFKSGPEDVIDPTITGNMIHILHANEKTNLTNVVIQAEIAAKDGYEPTIITCVVEITQAEQENFKFKDTKIQMLPNSKIEAELEGKETEGPTTLKSNDKSIVAIDSDGITLISKDKEGTTTVTVTHKGDRDYKDASDTLEVEVTNTPAYPFAIDVSDATYGDEPYLAEVTQSQPTTGAEITRTWTSSDESVATIDPLTGEITIIGAGSTTITCTQSSSIDPDVKDSIVLNVAPKPLEIIIDDQEKYVGEAVPEFTVQIPTEELVGSDTLDQPTYTCVDTNGLSVSETTRKGSYDIQASYPANKYPNYDITFVKGTLTIHQDESSEAWYKLIGKDSGHEILDNVWINEPVYVALQKTESDPYDEISLNQSDWDNNHILVETEGITKSDVYFQKSDTNALATNQNTTIKIDTTKPEITSITGEEIKQDEISKLLNQLTFGKFFKPQDEIIIQVKDIQPKGVSDISGLKEVHYQIFSIDQKTGLPETEVYDEDTITANMETIKFKVDDIGLYRICAITTDHAGNSSTTKCSDINVKEIDVDKDGDQITDMNDSDNDGCPDLNIVLGTDSKGNKVKLNVAEKGKSYPYMNIDSNGDGKADLNIDTDGDKKPDLNLTILTEKDWKPKTCVLVEKLKDYSNPIEYCTGTDVKPQINVDTSGNKVPNINIDNNGDMIANINIDTTGDAKPNVNINTLETWVPNKDYTIQGFSYDTMSELKPYLNIDSDGDGRADINVDVNGDGTADLNIDTDNDGIPNIDIDSTGDGEPDINVDTTGDGTPDKNIVTITEWIPKKDCESDGFKYDTMEIKGNSELEDNGVIVEKPDGTFLPNYAIKVNDVTESKKEEVEKEATNQIKETQEVKAVYDVLLLENDVEVQPDGTLKVRIPIPEGTTNPKLLVRRSNGSYETVTAKEENGYLVYETKELGTVTVIGDKVETPIDPKPTPDPKPSPPDPEPTPTPEPNEPKAEEPNEQKKPTVQGTYYPGNNVGGASTGDASNMSLYFAIGFASLGILTFLLYKKKEG